MGLARRCGHLPNSVRDAAEHGVLTALRLYVQKRVADEYRTRAHIANLTAELKRPKHRDACRRRSLRLRSLGIKR
jgi:hypothetical protein